MNIQLAANFTNRVHGSGNHPAMNDFPFVHSDQGRSFCKRVHEALVRFCGKSDLEADSLLRAYWAKYDDIESDPLLYHESPYFYAMCIAHHPEIGDNQPGWYKDRSLWPPPSGWETE